MIARIWEFFGEPTFADLSVLASGASPLARPRQSDPSAILHLEVEGMSDDLLFLPNSPPRFRSDR